MALLFPLTMEVPAAGLSSAMGELWLCLLTLTALFDLTAPKGRGGGTALGPPLGPMERAECAVGSSGCSEYRGTCSGGGSGEQWGTLSTAKGCSRCSEGCSGGSEGTARVQWVQGEEQGSHCSCTVEEAPRTEGCSGLSAVCWVCRGGAAGVGGGDAMAV